MNKRLEPYIKIIGFLGEVMGKNFEIVLHDLSNLESSVVAAANSNRKPGDSFWGPISAISEKMAKKEFDFEEDYFVNYDGITQAGKLLKFSSFFIKDENGKTIGLIGINADYSDYSALKLIKEKVDLLLNSHIIGNTTDETLDSIENIVFNIIEETINEFTKGDSEISFEQKIKLVEELNKKGVFMVKGTIQKIAQLLDMSEPSIYRYLNKVK